MVRRSRIPPNRTYNKKSIIMNKLFIAKLLRGDSIILSIRIEASDLDLAWENLHLYIKNVKNVYDDYYIVPENK